MTLAFFSSTQLTGAIFFIKPLIFSFLTLNFKKAKTQKRKKEILQSFVQYWYAWCCIWQEVVDVKLRDELQNNQRKNGIDLNKDLEFFALRAAIGQLLEVSKRMCKDANMILWKRNILVYELHRYSYIYSKMSEYFLSKTLVLKTAYL